MTCLELTMAPTGLEDSSMRSFRRQANSEIARWALITVILGITITWSSLILGIGWPIRILVAGVSSLNLARDPSLGSGRRERDITLTGGR